MPRPTVEPVHGSERCSLRAGKATATTRPAEGGRALDGTGRDETGRRALSFDNDEAALFESS
jgi:hypothetical protein